MRTRVRQGVDVDARTAVGDDIGAVARREAERPPHGEAASVAFSRRTWRKPAAPAALCCESYLPSQQVALEPLSPARRTPRDVRDQPSRELVSPRDDAEAPVARSPRGGQPPGRAPAMRVEALRNFDYPEAILFDCDGVLCETERDGHRVTFNMTFKEKGLDHEWGVDQYGELLKIGGGKERMTHYFNTCADEEPFATTYPDDDDARKDYIKSLHLRKTDLFLEVVQAGKLPLRPGVRRLVKEALDNGAKVAVCSTSNEKAVKGIVATMLPEFADRIPVFAGDVVPKKNPPQISITSRPRPSG